MKRTHSLIHRGYLYAQKRSRPLGCGDSNCHCAPDPSEVRMVLANAWRQGYLQSRRDAKKGQ